MTNEDPFDSVPVPPRRPPCLLVVDDDTEIRSTVGALFSGLGYEVATARNGREALDRLARRRPDVVLTDIFMEGMDGLELIDAIRKGYGTTPVAAMSAGRGNFDPLSFASKLGADVVISKPFRCWELVEVIDGLVHAYRQSLSGTSAQP